MIRKLFVVFMLLAAHTVLVSAQHTSLASSNIDQGKAGGTSERVSLTEELDKAVVEPNSKRFRMNIPFALGTYSTASPAEGETTHQYIWNNFNEGFIMLKYSELRAGTIPTAPEARKQWAVEYAKTNFAKAGIEITSEKDIKIGDVLGKEFEGTFRGKNVTIRTFAQGDVCYVLTAIPVPDNAGSIIQKLFDSFEFVVP
jgi:hypothetical protein